MKGRLHATARWQRRRLAQLRAEPLCRFCRAQGFITPATVADHVVPHRGDPRKFWEGELQSLCEFHHNSAKKRLETSGTVAGAHPDGTPRDENHWWNRSE